jgi:GTPase involved in cell partitioning and DNA repair
MFAHTSVGKSTLLTTLTGTYSVAADYEFTTLTTVPGIIRYQVCSTPHSDELTLLGFQDPITRFAGYH